MRTADFYSVRRADWDALAEVSDDAWLNHHAEWIDTETRFFVGANLSFAILDGDKIVALQPLYLDTSNQGTPYGETLIHSGIHRHTGLALFPGLTRSQKAEAQKLAMARILDLARSHGADRIQLNAHNLAPRQRRVDRDNIPFWVMDYGFDLGMGFGPHGLLPAPGFGICNADQIVNLSQTVEALFDAVDAACRRAIRKAEKAGLSFSIVMNEVDIERYWTLALRSASRTGEQLPPREYYQHLADRFGSVGKLALGFASQGGNDVAALMLLIDKGAASFVAGVSEPEALPMRPNDFIHWNSILACKSMGLSAYRFGPVFPEVPSEWAISRVSSFKGKFGGVGTPIIQGSLFLKPRHAEACVRVAMEYMTEIGCLSVSPTPPSPSLAAEYIAHHLRLFGISGASTDPTKATLLVADAGVQGGWIAARQAADEGVPVVLLRPERAADFIQNVSFTTNEAQPPISCRAGGADDRAWSRLRSLHMTQIIDGKVGEVVVESDEGAPLWRWVSSGQSGMLLVGTDLHRDLLRFRQGDPAAAADRPSAVQWGIAGERPTYLFEAQLEKDTPKERMADWWMWTLRDALIRHGHAEVQDILPFGAKGMVVVTGDDDQAYLEDYKLQGEKLAGLPITYFLHPLTRHTAETLAEHAHGRHVEWEIHPDALDAPNDYAARLAGQAKWFETLTGRRPRLLRNHGFLNDGYWGHAPAWIAQGIEGSSNLPGFDGRIINGSLLPARLALDGELTGHWSVLTAFGDGVFFVHEWTAETAISAVFDSAKAVLDSGVPGILVFNLHPANHVIASGMNEAVMRLVSEWGFTAASLGDALEWFKARDAGRVPAVSPGMVAPHGLPARQAGATPLETEPPVRAGETRSLGFWQALGQRLRSGGISSWR